MRSASDWLDEYGESHSHPTNEVLHWICVPVIVLSLLGLLWSLPVPQALTRISLWLNWATLATLAALVYYCALSVRLATGIACAFALMFVALRALELIPWPLWATSLALFAAAWLGQFIGHAIEGRKPSFFKDVQFLLIGPLWLVMRLFGHYRLKY
jgi:uncharacterized membrane protein YGL010W